MTAPRIAFCLVLFALAMLGVRAAAHEIVTAYGILGTIITIGVLYCGARIYDRR